MASIQIIQYDGNIQYAIHAQDQLGLTAENSIKTWVIANWALCQGAMQRPTMERYITPAEQQGKDQGFGCEPAVRRHATRWQLESQWHMTAPLHLFYILLCYMHVSHRISGACLSAGGRTRCAGHLRLLPADGFTQLLLFECILLLLWLSTAGAGGVCAYGLLISTEVTSATEERA